jgi:hypothetical protein
MKTKDKVQLIQKKKSNFTFERLYGFAFFGFVTTWEKEEEEKEEMKKKTTLTTTNAR